MPVKLTRHNTSFYGTSSAPPPALPESVLGEEISRMLIVSNEGERLNLIRYNYSLNEYKPITTFDPLTVLIDGSIDHKAYLESQFASDQPEEEESSERDIQSNIPKLVRNQFNFCDRASQTTDCRPRHHPMQTEPPRTGTLNAECSQSIIYDAYMSEYKRKIVKSRELPTTLLPSAMKLFTIMERMVVQNLNDHLLQDFKYFEDPADDSRGNAGCLLPLWKFQPSQVANLSITCLCWNPRHSDLFAVSFGSLTFTKQGRGAIFFYSLKNPSHPAYAYFTECGVMSVDINKEFSNYVCAGLYDGSVAVFNLCKKSTQPEHQSKRGVHNMHISQIQWDKEISDDQLCCNSVSPDGQIVKWILAPNGLNPHVMVTLDISDFIEKSMVEMKILTFGSGITLDFHSTNNHIYLVGTEMGHCHLCSRAHATEALQTFSAHYSSVYKIAWNTFHPKIFITCSEDWTVKIWEHTTHIRKPLLVYDLGSQVYDVEWAPYSSTIFAAATANGQVFVFDLSIDKSEPLCSDVVVFLKKTRIMHLSFNKVHPVILIGDDRGDIICLKLSPNLRKLPKERKGKVHTEIKSKEMVEISRLDDVLGTYREKPS